MALFTVSPSAVINAGDINQFTNLLNGTTTGTTITVGNRVRADRQTGSSSGAGGYVGQVAGASPFGSFVAGDFVSDGTLGLLRSCVSGGAPGTWVGSMAGISKILLASPVGSVSFSSIPQGYTHLILFAQVKSSSTASNFLSDSINLTFNGVTSNGYNAASIYNTNSSTVSAGFLANQNSFSLASVWTSFSGSTPGSANMICIIPYYSQANFGKQLFSICHSSDGGAAAQVSLTAGGQYVNVSQAAITTITAFLGSGSNLVTGSYFGLYGVM